MSQKAKAENRAWFSDAACLFVPGMAGSWCWGTHSQLWLGSMLPTAEGGISGPPHPLPRSLKLSLCPLCFSEMPKHCTFSPGHLLLCTPTQTENDALLSVADFEQLPGLVEKEVQLKLPVFGSHSQMLRAFL